MKSLEPGEHVYIGSGRLCTPADIITIPCRQWSPWPNTDVVHVVSHSPGLVVSADREGDSDWVCVLVSYMQRVVRVHRGNVFRVVKGHFGRFMYEWEFEQAWPWETKT